MALENPYSNEFQSKRAKTQARVLYFLIIPVTLVWMLEYCSDRAYATIGALWLSAVAVFHAEATWPSFGQHLNAAFGALMPIILMVFNPKYAVFAICTNFFNLGIGLIVLPLSKMPVFLITNVVGWIICYQFLNLDEHEGSELPKYQFQDSGNFRQILISYMLCYIMLFGLARKEYLKLNIHLQSREALESLNKELEITNSKLKSANQELQDALQEKENFLLRFSHEIRNPLNSLLGNIDLCYEVSKESDLKGMLTDAKVSGEILLQLLNNVLDTAKVSVGRLEASANPHRFRSFLQKAWVICSEIIHKKGLYGCLSVNIDVPEMLEFDHHRIMQILINTVSNATKFTDQGYVKLYLDFVEGNEIKTEHMKPKHGNILMNSQNELDLNELITEEDMNEKPKCKYEHLTATKRTFVLDRIRLIENHKTSLDIPAIPITVRENNMEMIFTQRKNIPVSGHIPRAEYVEGYIRIEIVDSGCGIKKDDLKSLFEKFKQVDVNSSKRQIGTGLGLWITREIISLMEGNIEMYSTPNKGTIIVMMLKSKSCPDRNGAKSSSPFSPQSNSIAIDSNHRKEQVLVVEDIPYNQQVNKRLLEKCNVQDIFIANNGLKALDLFKEMGPNYFNLILMDIDMPVMDGKTATKKIRQFEQERDWTPANIVFLTAFAESKTQKELLDKNGEYRANHFISKPISLDMMRGILGRNNQSSSSSNAIININTTSNQPMSLKKSQNTYQIGKISLLDNTLLHSERKIILLVDDDSFNLTVMSKMLNMCGFETIQARNGQMALDLYEKNWKRIEVILMDCEMPVMDGLEATRLILERHKRKRIFSKKEIIIYGVTGHVGMEYKNRCLGLGMKEVLEKPITTEKLRALLLKHSGK